MLQEIISGVGRKTPSFSLSNCFVLKFSWWIFIVRCTFFCLLFILMYVKPVCFPLPSQSPISLMVCLLRGEGWSQGAYTSCLTLPGDLVFRGTVSHSPHLWGWLYGIWSRRRNCLVGLKGAWWRLKAWLLVIAVSLLSK